MLGSQTQLCTHTFSIHATTQVRPQGCQAREHAWRQLLKLVAAKVQVAVANTKGEIDQIEPEQSRQCTPAQLMCLSGFAAAKAL